MAKIDKSYKYAKRRQEAFRKGLKESDEKLRRQLKGIKDQSVKRQQHGFELNQAFLKKQNHPERLGIAPPQSSFYKRKDFAKSEQKRRKETAYDKAAKRAAARK